jgi:hypothetical protein
MVQVLAVQLESASWIKDAIRSVFWFLAKGALTLLDGIFLIIDDIWKFKFFDNPYVNKIYSSAIIVACTWLILKVILELIMRYFVDQEDNSSPTKVFKGVIFAIVMMFLIPPLFNWGYDLSSRMTQYVVSVSSNNTGSAVSIESSMSSMILTAFADDDKMEEKDKKYFIEHWWTVDYNDVVDDGLFNSGKYKYSFSTFTIFLVGLVVSVLLFFIGIQVAKRIIELALYKAIAPFVCTSLVSNKSHSFEVWCKGVMGTFLVTTVQYLCIGILFNVYGQVASGTSYVMSSILIVIGALLFIISSPQLVSALLNANTGATANMSELHSLTALGTSMIAMSRYGKTVDNSSNSNSSNDNSTSNGGGDSSAGGVDPTMNSNNSSSNLDSSNTSNSEDSNSNLNNNDNENSSVDTSSNDSGSDINPNDIPTDDLSSGMSNINMDTATSLSDRIDVYKDMTDSSYSLNTSSTPVYKTNIDWGKINVSNTEEHKS